MDKKTAPRLEVERRLALIVVVRPGTFAPETAFLAVDFSSSSVTEALVQPACASR
jgi:hypothetical protein